MCRLLCVRAAGTLGPCLISPLYFKCSTTSAESPLATVKHARRCPHSVGSSRQNGLHARLHLVDALLGRHRHLEISANRGWVPGISRTGSPSTSSHL